MKFDKLAKKNIKLLALYNEINDWMPIISERGSSSEWGTSISNGKAVIEFSPSDKSPSSLAHELLHFKVQKSGYKRLKVLATKSMYQPMMNLLITALDNELQHHKMYSYFIDLGYKKDKFYSPDDVNTKLYIESQLASLGNTFDELIILYLTIIAPGGCLSSSERNNFKKTIRSKFGSSAPFDEIDEDFSFWSSSSDYDLEPIVKKIFNLIDSSAKTWIGYDDGSGFPKSGFFIGKPFALDDF
ncbi:hypothetical protein MT390_02980 [Vibrio sp. 2-Bac 85]